MRITYYETYPIYIHPSYESPPLLAFSPTVSAIRAHVEHTLQHPENHVLIQLYHTARTRHGTLGQDGRRRARLAHREPLPWSPMHYGA